MRNFAPGDVEVSARFAASVRGAFEEDRVVLEAVHQGMATRTTPNIDLSLDAGALRFRRRLAELVAAEQAGAATVA
jgi:vanillate O-demethylase monooxygenase subunit